MSLSGLGEDNRKYSTNKPRTLYHVSPPDNYNSILERGVDPAFSQSHPERVYFCERRALFWAIQHIARKHKVEPENLIIFKVRSGKSTRHWGNGLWFDTRPKRAHYFDDAVWHIRKQKVN